MAGLSYHSVPCPLLAGSKLLFYVSRQSQERSSLCSHSLHQEDLKGWLAVFGFAEMSRFTAAQMPGWCLGLRQVPSPALWSCREKPLLSAWDKLNPLSSD